MKKCELVTNKFIYLGYLINNGYISPNPDKIKCLLMKSPPRNIKETRSMLGLVGYFRNFIQDYTTIIKPIQDLIKAKYFKWSEDCNHAFNSLRQKLVSEPLLKLPDFNLPFTIFCDASGYGIGAILRNQSGCYIINH